MTSNNIQKAIIASQNIAIMKLYGKCNKERKVIIKKGHSVYRSESTRIPACRHTTQIHAQIINKWTNYV